MTYSGFDGERRLVVIVARADGIRLNRIRAARHAVKKRRFRVLMLPPLTVISRLIVGRLKPRF
jgi:hypothetical protein